jgi:hypothetical protein
MKTATLLCIFLIGVSQSTILISSASNSLRQHQYKNHWGVKDLAPEKFNEATKKA